MSSDFSFELFFREFHFRTPSAMFEEIANTLKISSKNLIGVFIITKKKSVKFPKEWLNEFIRKLPKDCLYNIPRALGNKSPKHFRSLNSYKIRKKIKKELKDGFQKKLWIRD